MLSCITLINTRFVVNVITKKQALDMVPLVLYLYKINHRVTYFFLFKLNYIYITFQSIRRKIMVIRSHCLPLLFWPLATPSKILNSLMMNCPLTTNYLPIVLSNS